MAYEASHRFARISPRKVRPLADLIRGKFADDALNETLMFDVFLDGKKIHKGPTDGETPMKQHLAQGSPVVIGMMVGGTFMQDMEGLRESVLEAKGLGFDGKGCIHPRQIPVVHEAFAPDEAEIDRACKIVRAFQEAEERGLGIFEMAPSAVAHDLEQWEPLLKWLRSKRSLPDA